MGPCGPLGLYLYSPFWKRFKKTLACSASSACGIRSLILKDRFENPSKLISISKKGRRITSSEVQTLLHAKEWGIDVELFVRKNKEDKISKEFYYLGRMKATGYAKEFIMKNTNVRAVEIEWDLDTPVREDIYEYIVNN